MSRARLALPFLLLTACAHPGPAGRGGRAPVPLDPIPLESAGPDGESPSPMLGTVVMAGSPAAAATDASRSRDIDRLRWHHLQIPVAGVPSTKLEDTFRDDRDGGARVHNAIDILAPRNTPILAADDGEILRMSSNALGGITIFATDRDRQFVYYYAHLDHYDPAMYAGRRLTKGETIGYVGTTGNAPKNIPHLHFQIMRWPADGKYWIGEPINPFPVLRDGNRELVAGNKK